VPDLFGEARLRRLRGHLQDVAFHVELPAVIEAAQPAFFVAAVDQRGAPVRTIFVEHAEAAVAVAEHDQVLAEQSYAHRGSVRLDHFLGQAGRYPMPPHELAHRRIAFDTAQEIVFFRRHHGNFLQRARRALPAR
jgi:hypothetical protein